MKKTKILGDILFWLTIISLPLCFYICGIVGEASIFGTMGLLRYSWIMLGAIPFGCGSILIGMRLKRTNQRYLKNYIVAFVCLPLALIFGSYRVAFDGIITYDAEEIKAVEEVSDIDFPSSLKVATEKRSSYAISYAKIADTEELALFKDLIKSGDLWTPVLDLGIKGALPIEVQLDTAYCEYFTFYNVSRSEYNTCPTSGQSNCIFAAFDNETGRIVVLSNFVVDL